VFSDTAPAAKRALQFEMESRVLRTATLVIANSLPTAERLRELYGEREIEVLRTNGVDWPEHLPEKDWAHAHRTSAYAGSFLRVKGVADLVQAASELPGCSITHVRRRMRRSGGASAAARPSQARSWSSAGHVPQQEVMRGLRAPASPCCPTATMRTAATTSRLYQLFEYMAVGCAIVASDLPPLRAVLGEDEAGVGCGARSCQPGRGHTRLAPTRARASHGRESGARGARVYLACAGGAACGIAARDLGLVTFNA